MYIAIVRYHYYHHCYHYDCLSYHYSAPQREAQPRAEVHGERAGRLRHLIYYVLIKLNICMYYRRFMYAC